MVWEPDFKGVSKTFSNPGTVPALEYEQGKGIFDSNIINVYLDEKYPEGPLQPTEPLRRAQDKMLLENFAGVRNYINTGELVRTRTRLKINKHVFYL